MRRVMTTKGWQLWVQWKDVYSAWIELKNMKYSHPIELAEYAAKNFISDEPPLSWWVTYKLKNKKLIIYKFKSK